MIQITESPDGQHRIWGVIRAEDNALLGAYETEEDAIDHLLLLNSMIHESLRCSFILYPITVRPAGFYS